MRSTLVLAAVLVVGLVATARADEPKASPSAAEPPQEAPSAGNEAAAQALFDEALKLMESRRYAEACQKFASSQKLDPGAGTLFNLASCYEKNGQTASAWASFTDAQAVATKAGHPDWAERAGQRAAALEGRLARVVVQVPPESIVAGLTVERDAVTVDAGSYGVALPVDPGTYTITASAPRKKAWSTSVNAPGDAPPVMVIIPRLEDEPQAPATPPPLAAGYWNNQRVVGTGLGAIGVVVVAVGAVLGIAAKSKYDDATSRDCPGGGTLCNAEGVALGQDAHTYAAASTAAFLVGDLVLGAGIVLFATAPPSAASTQRSPAALPLRIVSRPMGRGPSLTLEGAW